MDQEGEINLLSVGLRTHLVSANWWRATTSREVLEEETHSLSVGAVVLANGNQRVVIIREKLTCCRSGDWAHVSKL